MPDGGRIFRLHDGKKCGKIILLCNKEDKPWSISWAAAWRREAAAGSPPGSKGRPGGACFSGAGAPVRRKIPGLLRL